MIKYISYDLILFKWVILIFLSLINCVFQKKTCIYFVIKIAKIKRNNYNNK